MPALRRSITRLAAIANAAPWVAVAPCLLVVLGRERGPTAVAALAVFFFVFVGDQRRAVGARRAAAHDVMAALGAPRSARLRTVQLPGCWPSVIDGLKLAAPAALAGAIFGEWYGAERGLGVLLIGGDAERPGRAAVGGVAAERGVRSRRVRASRAGPPRLVRNGPSSCGRTSRCAGGATSCAPWLIEVATAIGVAAVLVTGVVAVDRGRRRLAARRAPAVAGLAGSRRHARRLRRRRPGPRWRRPAVALVIGVIVGVVAAVLAARARFLAGAVVPVVVVLAATPLVALFPLFARVLGYEPATVRFLAAAMVFFPVFVYTRSGLAAAGAAGASMPSTRWARRPAGGSVCSTVPAAVPHIASGCRIAAGSAVIAAVVGESLIGDDGLGVEFSRAYRQLELPRAFGAAIVIVVVSVAVFAVAGAVERAVHRRWT